MTAAPSENATGSPSTLPTSTPATSGQSEPSTSRDGPVGREQQADGCRADAQSSSWLSQGFAPISGWWAEFSRRHPGRTTPVTTGGWAPIVDLQLDGLDASSRVFAVHRRWMGQYRKCYEAALGKDPALQGRRMAPPLQGDWVARIRQQGDRICSVDVLETTLPDEMSNCLRDAALRQPQAGPEDGQLEMVLVFRVP
jgi:hypothetical protein